uniref:Keratin-associated protein n=1 Tax=Castor canadensis TaxID=51338 RepID=A0A8C0ZRL0_CASCN
MSYNCCSGSFSSCSHGGLLPYSGSSCGSSYPSNQVHRTNLCLPSTCYLGSFLQSGLQETVHRPVRCQTSNVVSSPCHIPCHLGSSLHSGCQDTIHRPIRCQTSYVVSRPCHTPCHRPRISTLCDPRQTNSGSLGCGSSSCSRPVSCGSSGLRPLGYRPQGFSSLGCGSGLYRPSYLPSSACQSSCYRPTCGTGSGF